MFFHIRPTNALLADINEELIGTYCSIRENWRAIQVALKTHHIKHSKEHYYRVRHSNPSNKFERAARFIYLNRTCWNGLYRVNLKGEFNVPIGTKNSVILPTDNFKTLSQVLKQATIVRSDFEDVINKASKGDFVYVDPPYTVNHKYNSFLKYNECLFEWEDQIRLRDCLVQAKRRGAKILVSNADHVSVRKLYKGVGQLIRIKRNSVIAADRRYRGCREELLIKCY